MNVCVCEHVCVRVPVPEQLVGAARMISLTHVLKEEEKESARGDDFSTHLGNFDL